MTRTEHNLPFSELSDRRFEQLCFALLRAEGHTDVRHWGDAGSERGCDVVSTDPDGRRWATQAKRVQNMGPTPAVAELTKVLDEPPDPEPGVYLLAASCSLSRTTEETLREAIVERGKTWDVKCWGRSELDAKVRSHPEVRDRFFGDPSRMRGPHWNVPNRNDFFTGREEVLAALAERLETAGTAALTQTIYGLGGVGKTQVAIEFCHRHRERYDAGVFWADASSVAALQASFAGFAVAQGLARTDDPVEEAADRFRHRLSREDGWLLVLDNADVPDEIRPLLPRSAAGHMIVTTRARESGFGRHPLPVDVLPPEQATEFLLDRARRDARERASARGLADALGFLPLALEQAGAYLARHPVAVADYLERFHQRRLSLIERQAPEQGEYGATVATTWDLSFQQVEEASPAAAEAMWACAFLAPDGIPLELFVSTGDRLGPALGALAEEAAEEPLAIHERLVEPLTRYSLVRFDAADGGRFAVHRLVQEVIRERLEAEVRGPESFERAHRALDGLFPQEPGSPASWPAGARWFPHVQSVLGVWRELQEEPEWDPTALWLRTAFYAWAAGLAASARELAEEALSVSRRVLGAEHPSTLTSMNNLAETLWALGDSSGARELHEEALSVRRRVLGAEHPDTLTSMNNLAETLRALGDSSGARELHEEALSVRRRVLGAEHPSTLTSMNNLAETLRALGDSFGARELEEEALSVSRRVLGAEHPDTLISMHNLCVTFDESDGMEVDRQMVDALLAGVRKLPERTPIRVAAEARWGSDEKK